MVLSYNSLPASLLPPVLLFLRWICSFLFLCSLNSVCPKFYHWLFLVSLQMLLTILLCFHISYITYILIILIMFPDENFSFLNSRLQSCVIFCMLHGLKLRFCNIELICFSRAVFTKQIHMYIPNVPHLFFFSLIIKIW